jgi:protein-S-isoprenylcysteine O-methyltransferase Ste14
MTAISKTLLFTLLVPGSVAGFVPWWILSRTGLATLPPIGLRWLAGMALVSAGIAIYGWCAWDFTFAGRGTPAPIDPPKELVVRGLYRWSRNPMYVGVLSVLAGETVLFRALPLLVYALVVLTMFQLFIVLYEEPHLQRTFGTSYAEYCSRVPRWFPVAGGRTARHEG